MATITEIVLDGRGTAGAWRVFPTSRDDGDGRTNRLYHYSTCMLTWDHDNPCNEEYLDYDTGWGSVSDQGGMNRAFKALGIPRYFSRDERGGGPRIEETDPANAEELRRSFLDMRERYAWVR